jgi:error-prone DNA polymerase
VYASAYLKAHYPAAFYTALLNNQPMGFYHPATLVKDAQRHGVRFAPVDVQESDWPCRVDPDGRVRLGLMYVNGLRAEVGKTIAAAGDRLLAAGHRGPNNQNKSVALTTDRCPKCGCDDESMLEETPTAGYFCNICAHQWSPGPSRQLPAANSDSQKASRQEPVARSQPRYVSLDDFITRTGIRRDELATLAEIGALNAFGYDRRSALWQIEKAVRPRGELFDDAGRTADAGSPIPPDPGSRPSTLRRTQGRPEQGRGTTSSGRPEPVEGRIPDPGTSSPLRPMTPPERLMADYAGTSLTIGPHPLSLRRAELALRGVLRASDLPLGRHGRRVRVAGAVITRQRPGTAKGFVFLTLEDETGIANVIVRPDLFTEQKSAIVGEPYLLVEGTLQIQDGVISVKADRVIGLSGGGPEPQSHDFR